MDNINGAMMSRRPRNKKTDWHAKPTAFSPVAERPVAGTIPTAEEAEAMFAAGVR